MVIGISELLGNSIPSKIDSLEINNKTGPFENNANHSLGILKIFSMKTIYSRDII